MKPQELAHILVVLLLGVSLGCKNQKPPLSIEIQPIGTVNPAVLRSAEVTLANRFHGKVTVNKQVVMPSNFLNVSKSERYSADAILNWLRPDRKTIVLAITSNDIYTNNPQRNDPLWGVLGLGKCPGNDCIISDHRFKDLDPSCYEHRLQVLILHEIGHNLGLPHCNSPHCMMNDADGKLATLDSCGLLYCERCQHLLKQAPFSWK
jgi:archaemetzincin